jgi:uncharacterized membrane protein YcaP (DUF421 family)
MDMILRALAIYLILVLVFKIAGRLALLGSDFSVTGAALSIVTLIVMDMLFSKVKKYLPGAEEMIDGTAVILVENGVLMHEKMKLVDISEENIMVSARNNQGLTRLAELKFAILESNGHICIIAQK